MVEVRRREGESAESMLRRFTRKVQQSGVIIRAKKGQFRARKKTKDKLREEAVRRTKIRSKNEYLRKIGKLEELGPRGRSDSRRR